MKKITILFLLSFALLSFTLSAQIVTLRRPMSAVQNSELPFVGSKAQFERNPDPEKNIYRQAVRLPDSRGLNLFVWEDLQCTQNQRFKNTRALIIRKIPLQSGYILNDIEIYAAAILKRHILATYDTAGALVDQLEGAVFGESVRSGEPLWIKQFRIDPGMKVTLYSLKVSEDKPILFFDDFQSVRAQRVDTQYQIDATGHFKKIAETKYKQQTYTLMQLTDPHKNIWDGAEVPLK